ncbi:hypothetical protein FRB95_014876 [Tulasnella sp. JGI-2019a]|nr:hypothetical protein FRB95_014876 [Tulasnella sp. JGI-2019a]
MKADSIVSDHSLQSLARAEWLSFSGGQSEHVLLFVQAVHRFAFAHGRQKDDVWMADYAYGCLSGEMLDWFEDLDPDVRQDWSRLRPGISQSSGKASWLLLLQQQPLALVCRIASSPVSRSRVRVVRGNGTVLGYMARPRQQGHLTVAVSADEALVLNIPDGLDKQQEAAHIKMASCNSDIPYPFLGLENYKGDYWVARACEKGMYPSIYFEFSAPFVEIISSSRIGPEGSVFKDRSRADTNSVPQEASSKVWSIKKLDDSTEELCIHWLEDTGVRSTLQAMIPSASESPIKLWMRKAVKGSEELVKLILERF